ncbi:shikimate dehydrogenase [Erysipelothrix urinaevulpis]|uniref:shikimate dehydrogenase n=1 Tax=Erysipelothrix urinaevulpis TaxID=2683717 RepID=UPI0013599946|nr:shikimate dehydrogenase [Erysipelothrix urinaevulpis]
MGNIVNAKTRLLGLFADPHDHSKSPDLYNEAFRRLDINAIYLSFNVNGSNIKETVDSFKALNFLGANVSMPNKVSVIPYLDRLDKSAELVGAVNCLVVEDEAVVGYNTDGIGFTNNLKKHGVKLESEIVTLLGVGGAGTAIAAQLCLENVKELYLFNIKDASFELAQDLVKRLESQTNTIVHLIDLLDEEQLKKAILKSSILINATSMGMEPHEDKMALPHANFIKDGMVVADTIYNPETTVLLDHAKEKNCQIINGEGMLIGQAEINFKMWTGQKLRED